MAWIVEMVDFSFGKETHIKWNSKNYVNLMIAFNANKNIGGILVVLPRYEMIDIVMVQIGRIHEGIYCNNLYWLGYYWQGGQKILEDSNIELKYHQ